MKLLSIVTILSIIPSFVVGSIIETECFGDILHYIDHAPSKKTLVVCDLDNTLIMPRDLLGSVVWAEYLQDKLMCKGVSVGEADIIQHILWKTVQPYIEMKTVDPRTTEIIHELRKRQIPVLGLTARFPEDSWFTFEQLQAVDIDLTQQDALPERQIELPLEPMGKYEDGVLFSTTYNKKSEVFMKFLEMHRMDFERILFVDDKLHHVEDVESACRQLGIECIGVRYGGADKYFDSFDPVQAEREWESFSIQK